MKILKLKSILFGLMAVLMVTAFLSSCTKDDISNINKKIQPDAETISKLIEGFDNTLNKIQSTNASLTNEEMGEMYFNEVKLLNVEVVKNDLNSRSATENYSVAYNTFGSQIADARNYGSKDAYVNHLTQLNQSVLNSNISVEEKQLLVNNIAFANAFVNWLEQTTKTNESALELRWDWWDNWGKCASGIIGGGFTGGTAGGIGGGMAGNSIFADPIWGAAVGGTLGGIGGAFNGAASNC